MIAKFILSDLYRRPVFNFIAGNSYYTALLDTGAVIPVFTFGSAKIRNLGGRSEGKRATFRGFGGKCAGELYRVDLKIGALKYVSLPVICLDDPAMEFSFILPATLFSGFSYTINDAAKILTVDTLSSATTYRLKIAGSTTDVMVMIEDIGKC